MIGAPWTMAATVLTIVGLVAADALGVGMVGGGAVAGVVGRELALDIGSAGVDPEAGIDVGYGGLAQAAKSTDRTVAASQQGLPG